MYLLIYPSVSNHHPQRGLSHLALVQAEGFDFITPDGVVVPRALGEAALQGRTAVLVGGLLVGLWPKAA
jgi:hypothetical protein